jgi:hypothetical protein
VAPRLVLTGTALVFLLALAGSATGSQSTHSKRVWSGQWSGSPSGVGFYWVSDATGAKAIRSQGGKPCGKGSDYFRGGYFDPPSGRGGKVTGCTQGVATRLVGRYVGDKRKDPGAKGSFDINFVPPNRFEGKFIPDGQSKKFPWKATFNKHYSGDLCCPTPVCRGTDSAGSARGDPFRFQAFLTENGKIVSKVFGTGAGTTDNGCGVDGTVEHVDYDPKTGKPKTTIHLDVTRGVPDPKLEPVPDRQPSTASLTLSWDFVVRVTQSDDFFCPVGKVGRMEVNERRGENKHRGSVKLLLCRSGHSHDYPNASVNLGPD